MEDESLEDMGRIGMGLIRLFATVFSDYTSVDSVDGVEMYSEPLSLHLYIPLKGVSLVTCM